VPASAIFLARQLGAGKLAGEALAVMCSLVLVAVRVADWPDEPW
jgi:3-oxoacyl-[acyl-carrier-protein] synthase III